MQLPVIIERLPDGRGFTARMTAPLQVSAEANTPEEAQRKLAAPLQHRLHEGMELRALSVPATTGRGAEPGWLPDDDLTREWLQEVRAYRDECDAADRARLDTAPPGEPAS